ncbi:BQ2448_3264 [Microbotryum intermedium]|uniref:BQ2448_3264 protein n=1 Tax=Microbotryum intermedium TaxID=269621 RepID=A0A238FKT1_9BASI|nr:BQ2448_3264 [Microbotryum intermedium]
MNFVTDSQGQSLAQAGSLLKRLADGARLHPRQDIAGGIGIPLFALSVPHVEGQCASTGECHSKCSGWTDALSACTNTNTNTEAIGRCACASDTLSKMSMSTARRMEHLPCATCFDSQAGFTTFHNLCGVLNSGTIPSTSAGASASASGSADSSASASAAQTSSAPAVPTTSPTATEALATTAPAATSAATTTAAVTSAAAAATASRAASSGNGRGDMMAGSAMGAFAFIVALLA